MNHWNIFSYYQREQSGMEQSQYIIREISSEKLNKKYIVILASLRNDRLIQVIFQFFSSNEITFKLKIVVKEQ